MPGCAWKAESSKNPKILRTRKEHKNRPDGLCKPFSRFSFGADDETRTRDLILTKDVLYLLSYISATRILL
jgi:hypothetical protein